MLLDNPSQDTAEMSEAPRNFEPKKKVNTMTAIYGNVRRVRPHGLDRAVMRASLAMLLWARRHADRTAVSHEEHTRMYRETQGLQRREHDAALLVARVR